MNGNKVGRAKQYDYTLCLDCGKASDPEACPWVRNATPVPGWVANPTIVSGAFKKLYHSFQVRACPIFDRDSFGGGTTKARFCQQKIKVHNDNVLTFLAEAIIERAIDDWRELRGGELRDTKSLGERVYRADLVDFFYSDWINRLLGSFTDIGSDEIRQKIGIDDEMRLKYGGGDHERRR